MPRPYHHRSHDMMAAEFLAEGAQLCRTCGAVHLDTPLPLAPRSHWYHGGRAWDPGTAPACRKPYTKEEKAIADAR